MSISHGFTLHIWITSMILTNQFGAPNLLQIVFFAGSASVGYSLMYAVARWRRRTTRNTELPAAPSQLPALALAGTLAALMSLSLPEAVSWILVPAICTAVFIAGAGFSLRLPKPPAVGD